MILILTILAVLLLFGFGITLHVLWWLAAALLIILILFGITR